MESNRPTIEDVLTNIEQFWFDEDVEMEDATSYVKWKDVKSTLEKFASLNSCGGQWVKASEDEMPKEIGKLHWRDAGTKDPISAGTAFSWIRAGYTNKVEFLDESLPSNQKELQELRAWKESAINVMPDMQAIGKAMNVKLGESVHDKILPFIDELRKENERLKGLIFKAWKQSEDNVCIEHGMYDKDEFEEGEKPAYKHLQQFKTENNL